MRALLIPLLLLASGCVGPPAAGPPTDAVGERAEMPWSLSGCRYLVGTSPADPVKMQARLPDGFTLAAGSLFGVAPMPLGSIGTEAFDCERGSGLDGEVQGMTYGSIWFSVVPPEEHVVDGVSMYFWKESILVPDEPRRALLAARGLPVHAGGVSWGGGVERGARSATLSLAGFGDFGLSLEAPQAGPDPDGGEFLEFTRDGAGGIAVWRANYSWDGVGDFATGRGTIRWPEGTWAADAVGASVASGQFHAGTWSFGGTLRLPTR